MEKLYKSAPVFIQNAMISVFNIIAYRKRYRGAYKTYRKEFAERNNWSLEQLKKNQEERFAALVNHAQTHSTFYKNLYQNLTTPENLKNVEQLPIVIKDTIRKNIDAINTINKNNAIISKTGGTTGKSLEVLFTLDNFQERFALLDNFRNSYGYELGKKTAWFSGKSLLGQKDVKKRRFWRTDYYHKVRYYSTFHIKKEYLSYYIENLIKFKPQFMVGFPSSIFEIANHGNRMGIDFPVGMVQGIFPTAESLTTHKRTVIETFFKTKMYDQYASSEGAPFIFECQNGNLHLELQSGVFEVLDENNCPAKSGRLVTTSFTTYGTPLIRYDIGDSLVLSDKKCSCGNNNPLVDQILGRIDDYVYSPDTGKINLGNISNTLKGTKGIIKLQVIQNEIHGLEIFLVVDETIFNKSIEKKFIQNWRERIGQGMKLEIKYVKEIPVAKSGKYRMVINNIKDLL